MSTSKKNNKSSKFIKKVLAEAINKAEREKEDFNCNSLNLFVSLHEVNLSDVAHYVVELREAGLINENFGKDLRCIELNPQ